MLELRIMKSIIKVVAKRKVPLRVSYFCTFRCNLRCEYCGLWKTKRNEMTTEQAKSMIGDFASAGTMFWMFTGGEPMLRRDIGELVSEARGSGMVVGLVTNGTMLTRKLDELSELSYLVVSLDGEEKINDRIRGKGSYRKTINSIKKAVDEGFDLTINSVISEENTRDGFKGIREIISTANDLGTKVNFSVLYEDFANRGVSLLPEEDLISALKFIREQKGKTNLVMSDACLHTLSSTRRWRSCRAGRLFCDVTPDGAIVPCLFKTGKGVSGLKHGFVKAFEMLGPEEMCFCRSTCYNELNSTLHMEPRALLENFIKYSGFLVR